MLSDVQHTGTIVGVGSYSSVEEVSVPVDAAAKTVHGYLPDDRESATQFLRDDEHHPPSEYRPVLGRVLFLRLPCTGTCHGANADESSQFTDASARPRQRLVILRPWPYPWPRKSPYCTTWLVAWPTSTSSRRPSSTATCPPETFSSTPRWWPR